MGTSPAAYLNLSTHTSKAMAQLIAARPWLTVFRLPPYAHELNPVEPVRSHLKRSLANLTKHTLAERDCSGGRRDPDVSAGEFGENVEGSAAVFGRGR